MKDFCCVLNVWDFYYFYLGSLLGVTLEYHLNSLCLMYQQHTTPLLIWSNLILDLCETSRFYRSLKSLLYLTFLLIYQTHLFQWYWWVTTKSIFKISKFWVFYYFALFYDGICFVVYCNKLKLASAIFIKFLFFHQMIALQTMKNAFYFI